jgi:hypothetical protein
MSDAGAIAGAIPTQLIGISEPIRISGGSTPDSTLASSCFTVVHCALDANQNSKYFHHFTK